MQEIPLKLYAAWPNPNFVDPVRRGDALVVVNVLLIILVTLAFILRLYWRLSKSQGGIDDIMIAIAYLFTVGLTTVVLLAFRRYGWDRHIWDIDPNIVQSAQIIAFCAKMMFVFASGFTRLSLMFLYYRLVKESTIWWYKWIMHFGMFVNVSIFITLIFTGIFQCTPPQKYWQFPNIITSGSCLDEGVNTMSAGVLSCIADLLCTALPVPVIWSLNMPLRERISVIILLSAGMIVTVAGALRTYFIYSSLFGPEKYDQSWSTYPLWICAAIEIDLAIICACAPAMKALLWKPFRKWTSDVYSGSNSKNNTRASVKPSKIENSRRELTSQDPIVEDDEDSSTGYRLDSMDFGKNPNGEAERDLEKAIQANHSTSSDPNADKNQSQQTCYDPTEPKLQISKETTFQVTYLSDASSDKSKSPSSQDITALPPSEPTGRPRHKTLNSNGQSSSGWKGITGTRRSNPSIEPLSPQTTPP